MAYAVKYILQFSSDRGNEVRIEVLKKDYQGEVIYKSLGGSPSLSIEQGDGAIKGSSLVFAMQADVEGELQELYTTDNKQFKVNMYRNEVLSWQGYILPELYSEEYIDAPYDVSVTATDQLATLKAITYQREDVNVSLSTIIEDILSFTQISVPVTYHQNLSAHRKGEVPMLVDSHISQAAYNGHSCYDVLNNILLSCNCCIMQINGEWLITSLTNSTTNYYTAGVTQVREHKTLGQLGVGEVCPAGTLTMVNNPALKGAKVEYAHMLRNSFLVNADCVDREGWNYTPDSRNPIDIPGEREAFGKIFKAYCWELHPVNIRENNSLQLWQEVFLEKDERNYYDLSVKTLFGTDAKLLLMAVTYLGSDGVERRLTSEGWIERWDKSDVNYYIQITGTNKNAGLDAIADIEQYEMSTVQFALPPVDGTMRVGFINSTTDYAEPLASAPIYVSQVYLTVSGVTGQECTTEVEPNATQEQQDVLLAYGDTFESENAYKLGLNTLKKSSGENITSWWLDNVNFSSYYDTMLQEFSRYFGVKKAQLQGIIMGKDVLSDMYADVFSGRVMRLLSAQVDMLADEASVTVEEVITTTVDFDTVIYANNNTNSFGASSGGGAGTSGGASSTAGESLLGVQSDGDVYVKDARALVGQEGRFENLALPVVAPLKRAERKTYVYASNPDRGVIDLEKIAKYIEDQEALWVLDKENGVIRTTYNVVSEQEIISGRRASGSSSDVTGGGGISQITAQMIADALGYVPYSSANPAGYINSSALNGYATEQYVTSRGYITANALTKANVGLGEVQNYGVFNQTSFKGKIQYAVVNSSILEIANRIDFHVSESTADYEVSLRVASGETTKRVIYLPAAEGTLALVSQIPSVPTALKSPYALTFGAKAYDGSEAKTITAADLGALTAHQDISHLLSQNDASKTYQPIISISNKLPYTYISGTPTSLPASDVYEWAKASAKPSYTASEVGALSIEGGTISKSSYVPLVILNTASDLSTILYKGASGDLGYLGFNGASNPVYMAPSGYAYTLIHSGNYSSYALPLSGGTLTGNLTVNGGITCDHITRYDSNAGYLFGSRNTALGLTDGGALVYAYGNTPISMYTNGLERMRVLGNGNVLIGTATDSGYKLQVNGTIDSVDSATFGGVLVSKGGRFRINTSNSANSFGFLKATAHTSSLNRAVLDIGSNYGGSSNITSESVDVTALSIYRGVVGVGRAYTYDELYANYNSNIKLYVDGGIANTRTHAASHWDALKIISVGSWIGAPNYVNGIGVTDGSGVVGRFGISFNGAEGGYFSVRDLYTNNGGYASSGEIFKVVGNGNVYVYGNMMVTGEVISSRRAASSDRRLKDNITYLDTADCLAMIRHIRPAEWDWKDNGSHSMGFIAQDIEPLMPYAVTRIKDDALEQKLNLQYDQFIALAIGGVQAVDSEVQQLKKEVAKLKQKLSKYETVWQ